MTQITANNLSNRIMTHLDFTIDFETCALSGNAAPIQVAIVPWRRDAEDDPFAIDKVIPFVRYVDLRTCVVDGYDFDHDTISWWSRQSAEAKDAVCDGTPEPVTDVMFAAINFLRDTAAFYHADSVCLWCQGPDVDIAILRNFCKKHDVCLEDTVPHTSFRDCRTIILEAALLIAERSMTGKSTRARGIALPHQILTDPTLAYKIFDCLPEKYQQGTAHDALYDAMRSSWNTWQALQAMRQ